MRRTCESGQATVEAAFLLPVLFVGLLLLMQPGILLYDRLVMQAAASEGCRLLATKNRCGGRHGRELRGVRPPPLGSDPSRLLLPRARGRVQLGHPVRRRRALGRGCASPSRTRLVRCRCWMQAALWRTGIVERQAATVEVRVTAEQPSAAVVGALVR